MNDIQRNQRERPLAGTGALITGGSRGLGRALGETLAAKGAAVVLIARHAAELDAAVDAIRTRGGDAHGIVADVADANAVFAIAGQATAAVGHIDLLVNNASTLGPVPLRLLADTDCEDLERALAVNVVGPFRLTKAIVGPMILRGHGTVINVTSDAAVEAYPRWGAYGATKAALEHLTRTWAAELADTGVRFVALDPGEMNTRMHEDAVPDADVATLSDATDVAGHIVEWIESGRAAVSDGRLAAGSDGIVARETRR